MTPVPAETLGLLVLVSPLCGKAFGVRRWLSEWGLGAERAGHIHGQCCPAAVSGVSLS